MLLNLAYNQRPQYCDENGVPYSMGRVFYYDVGTTNLKSIYADPYGNVELDNPVDLDAGGYLPVSSVFYGVGEYTIRVEQVDNPGFPIPIYSLAYTVPVVPGSESSSNLNGSVVDIGFVEDLATVDTSLGEFFRCQQYYNATALDNGGGLFRWYPASTEPTNLGTVFASNATPAIGRFIRIDAGGPINSAWFGVATNTGSIMNARLTQAANYCQGKNRTLNITNTIIEISGPLTISDISVIIQDGVQFKRSGVLNTTMTFNNCSMDILQTNLDLFVASNSSQYIKFLNMDMDIYPEWFGAVGDGVTDNYQSFGLMQGSDGRRNLQGQYLVLATGVPITSPINLRNCYFGKDAYIQNEMSSSIDVDTCITAYDAQYCFRNTSEDFFNYRFNGPMPGNALFPLAITISMLDSLYFALVSRRINFTGKPVTYTIAAGGTINSPIDTYVGDGVLLDFLGDSQIGNIISGPWQIFPNVANGYPEEVQVIYPQWWGAGRSATQVINQNAIVNAMFTASNLIGGGLIEGNNEILIISEGALNINTLGIARAENLRISGGYLVFDSGGLRGTNCRLSGIAANGTSRVTLINCEIVYGGNALFQLKGVESVLTNCIIGGFEIFEIGSATDTSSKIHWTGGIVNNCFGFIYTQAGAILRGITFQNYSIPNYTAVPDYRVVFTVNKFSNSDISNNHIEFTDSTSDVLSFRWVFFDFVGNGAPALNSSASNNNFNIVVSQVGASANVWYPFRADGFSTYGHTFIGVNNICSPFCVLYQSGGQASVTLTPTQTNMTFQFRILFPNKSVETYYNFFFTALVFTLNASSWSASGGEGTRTYDITVTAGGSTYPTYAILCDYSAQNYVSTQS